MVKITVLNSQGVEREINAKKGGSLMETLKAHGFDEILAICGGSRACGTCHVHIDKEWLKKLDPIDEGEQMLIEGSTQYQENSRLSCQIPVEDALDGLKLTIPDPETI